MFDTSRVEALKGFFDQDYRISTEAQILSDGRQIFFVLAPRHYSNVYSTTAFTPYYTYEQAFTESENIIIVCFNTAFYSHFNPHCGAGDLYISWERIFTRGEEGDKIYDSGIQVYVNSSDPEM
ncbi:MAG: hypothetical protein HXS52_11025 [Theionarchaea archaeon]|nr:hypothetical protein [Theionarchaea archaeon]